MLEPKDTASFLYDDQGQKTYVLLPIEQYEKLLEVLEDERLARAMQEADGDEIFSLQQALEALEDG